MKVGMQVVLGPGNNILDEDAACQFLTHNCCGQMLQESRYQLVSGQNSAEATLC